ncbi:diacylglycerol/lipid kinase family protein [Cohnella silvisoli]|uniref:Diacylglycerol kinase family lipid kinase n=1 Tax=Cohnella silvisoli TaxID=2873699 RepID=A0ABV1KMW7_9BACL|nr:diacylglycerol kinase family protein [Cohnella silvisoli]MCD9020521.1 diacylglycerol kinase family lipid kinase [Cohnella silvisoli]
MVLFIVNENSGNGRGKKIWAKVEKELRKKGTEYTKVATTSQAEAVAHAEELLQRGKMKAVAVIGGDGTLHGLLPLLSAAGIPYGLIPSGSGNDSARALGIPRNPIRALQIILAGHTRRIDLLETRTENGETQFTLTAVAIGLDSTVAADVNGSSYKRWCNKLGVGSLAYIIGFFRALAVFKPRPIQVTMDGVSREFTQGWLSAIANISTYGGGLKICPTALPDDGRLHVCIVHGCSVWRILLIFPTILNGSHVNQPYVTILSGCTVRIETPASMLAFGDGEPSGQTPITAVIRPRQLDFLIAASG